MLEKVSLDKHVFLRLQHFLNKKTLLIFLFRKWISNDLSVFLHKHCLFSKKKKKFQIQDLNTSITVVITYYICKINPLFDRKPFNQ